MSFVFIRVSAWFEHMNKDINRIYNSMTILSVTRYSCSHWIEGRRSRDRRQRLWPYIRSMCMWCLINKRWVVLKHWELKWERAPKKMSFLKELCSKSANCSRTFPKTGLSVMNSRVNGAVARRSAHELSHEAIKRLRTRSAAVRHWRDFSLKRLRTRSCHEWESLVSKFRS